MKTVGATGLGRFVGVSMDVLNKLALRTRLRNLSLKFQFTIFDRYPRSYLRFLEVCGRLVSVRVGVVQ